MKNFIICMCLLLSFCFSQAQQSSSNGQDEIALPTIIPPAPTVANLMRFEEVPVDHYSGQPGISIPLGSVAMLGGMNYPIGVHYNTQGIRVDERSGWLGTGFSMPTGGVISRTIRGIPDELNLTGSGIGIFHNDYEYFSTFSPAQKAEFLWKTANGTTRYDSDHDIYQYNFFGKGGRFIIKKQSNQLVPVVIGAKTNDQITILYDTTSFEVTGFEVKDTNGYIYVFEESNFNLITSNTTTTSQYGNSSNTSTDFTNADNVPNAWYLKEVKQPNGTILCSFVYQDVEENYPTPTSTVYNRLINQNINFGDPYVTGINKGMLLPKVVTSAQYIQSTQKYVKEVLFYDGSKVEYILDANGHPEYNTLNLPIHTTTKSGTKLKTIIVTAPNGTEHKRINFFYQTSTKNRLFLTKIDEVYGSETLSYLLDYNNKNELEGFGSDEKDTYGYFNDGPNTNAFISAKRWVNRDKITTGVLTSITYPTGGKKEFAFESNSYSYEGATPIDPLTIPENIIGQSRVATLTGSATITESPEKVLLYIDRGQLININTVINSNGSETILNNHKILLSKVQPISGTVNPPAVGSDNRLNYNPYSVSQFEYVASGFSYEIDIDEQSTIERSVSSGWYVIEMKTIQPYYADESSALAVTTTISSSTFDLKTNIKYGGGIRIKEIIFTDHGEEQKKTSFNYKDNHFYDPSIPTLAGTNTSSGSFEVDRTSIRYIKNKNHPFLDGYGCTTAPVNNGSNSTNDPAQYQTNTRTPVTASYEITRDINQVLTPITKGNYVGYKKVYIKQENAGGELYTFISPRDIEILTTDNTTYPFVPLENNDYKRGMLEKREIFNESKQVLVKEDFDYIDISNVAHTSYFPYEAQNFDCPWDQFYNTYSDFAGGSAYASNFLQLCGDDVSEPDISTCHGSNADMTSDPYNHIRGIKLPKEVVKTAYFYDGTTVSETVTTTKTLYNTKNRVKEKTTEFLEGGITTIYKEEIKYPYSYESSEYTTAEQTVLNEMVAENIIESPVQNKQYKNGTLIYDTQRIFEEFYPNVFKVSEIKSAKANTIKQSRVKFHKYNNLGQPLELSQTDGTRISYVWGYDNMYPIAKLENASYATMTSTQTSAIANAYNASNSDVNITTEDALQTALIELRDKFPNAMVTTLTYDPIVGATRTTDPRAYTSYFEYDELHRLKQVKDADKNILSANEYFYNNGNSSVDNYVKSIVYTQATQDGLNVANWNKVESINYADGLGRAKQAIGIRQGGNGQDIISVFEYDDLGRQTKEFLPYAATSLNGSIHNNSFADQATFYNTTKYENTTNPYSESHLEKSPLARVLEQGAPGAAWQLDTESDNDHTIKMVYQTNTYNGTYTDQTFDNVKRFNVSYGVNGFTDVTLQENGYYQEGELYKSIVKDENWQPNQTHVKDHTIEEFKDKLGRVVLKRTYNNEERHDTHYIYDDYGNLTHVLPPLVDLSNGVSASELTELCYQYKYDHRNRLIEKKIPGKEKEYIVYDKLDRPVLTQDPNLRTDNKWLFTKYDVFGRVTYTGIVINTGDRIALQTTMDSANTHESKTATATTIGNTAVYYTNSNYPNDSSVIVLTVNYYDDYLWNPQNSLEANYNLTYEGLYKDSNNVIDKTAEDGWGNAGFTTDGTIENDGYIQYTILSLNQPAMIGLSAVNSAEDHHYNTIDYAIYTGYGTADRIYVYNDGTFVPTVAITYQAGDTFKVERAGTQILFKKNNETFHIMETSYSGVLIGDGSILLEAPKIISNIHIGYSSEGQAFGNAKGLPTGSVVRTLTTDKWTTSIPYYDIKGRQVHFTSNNEYLDTKDTSSSLLDFTGKPIKNTTTHIKAKNKGNPVVTIDEFIYDNASRLLYQTKQINGSQKQLIVRNDYDELGQLQSKQVGGTLPSLSNYTNVNNIDVDGNVLTKTSDNAWDAGLTTDTYINGDGYVSYSVLQANKRIMVGLSDVVGNDSYQSIRYRIYTTNSGQISIFDNGNYFPLITSYTVGDHFKIERRNDRIYYLKNGETLHVSTSVDNGQPLLGDVAMYDIDGKIKNLVLIDLEKELQEVHYTYNVRGWLKGINENEQSNDLFSFALKYNDIADPTKQLFNGNISSTLWKTKGQDTSLKNYVYEYDALNRITGAVDNTGNYNLTFVGYDRNGNITDLIREGHINTSATEFDTMDDLSYQYSGNQLLNVTDDRPVTFGFNDGNIYSSIAPYDVNNDYDYDDNGNMIKDKNKGINTITYNYLNLPEQITFDNGSTITYIYDASGVKLEKVVDDSNLSGTSNTYYAGNYIYKKGNGQTSTKLMFFNSEEGYIEPVYEMTGGEPLGGGLMGTTPIVETMTGFDYIYQYKDHLGNIRLSYQDMDGNGSIDPITEIKEENHYYPFGLKHKGYNNQITGRDHNYGYNGIEESNEFGNNMLEMDMRQYDPAIARWVVIDPVTHHDYSPYQAFDNNPMFFADPSGADSEAIEGGTRYTGQDAKNVLAQLQSNYGGSGQGSNGDGDSNPFEGLSLTNISGTYFSSGSRITMGTNGVKVQSAGDLRSGLEAYTDGFKGGLATWEGLFSWRTIANNVNGPVRLQSIWNISYHTGRLLEPYIMGKKTLSRNQYLYSAGFLTEKALEALILRRVTLAIPKINYFGMNSGYGLFGRNGLKIGNYKMEMLYANPGAGKGFGTIFSLKQMKRGGSLFRWDYGPLHVGGVGLHSSIRFHMFGKKFGSTAQRTWYPPYKRI